VSSSIYFDSQQQQAEAMLDLDGLDERKLEEAISMHRTVYVDKHAFLHRLYVGLDMHFGSRPYLHQSLAAFLPETHQALTLPTNNRGQKLLQAWRQSMQNSIKAAENAAALGMPAFHWARVYRL
jgi:hypothetical protein